MPARGRFAGQRPPNERVQDPVLGAPGWTTSPAGWAGDLTCVSGACVPRVEGFFPGGGRGCRQAVRTGTTRRGLFLSATRPSPVITLIHLLCLLPLLPSVCSFPLPLSPTLVSLFTTHSLPALSTLPIPLPARLVSSNERSHHSFPLRFPTLAGQKTKFDPPRQSALAASSVYSRGTEPTLIRCFRCLVLPSLDALGSPLLLSPAPYGFPRLA